MRFTFIEEHRKDLPVDCLCQMLKVSSRRFRAWLSRPISQRQRYDMVLLAHIRAQRHLNLGTYGRPRMTQELKELGFDVEHPCIARLMRENSIRVFKTRKYKNTTDNNNKFNTAPNLLDRSFTAERLNQKWAGDISYIWTRERWLYLSIYNDGFAFTPYCGLRGSDGKKL